MINSGKPQDYAYWVVRKGLSMDILKLPASAEPKPGFCGWKSILGPFTSLNKAKHVARRQLGDLRTRLRAQYDYITDLAAKDL